MVPPMTRPAVAPTTTAVAETTTNSPGRKATPARSRARSIAPTSLRPAIRSPIAFALLPIEGMKPDRSIEVSTSTGGVKASELSSSFEVSQSIVSAPTNTRAIPAGRVQFELRPVGSPMITGTAAVAAGFLPKPAGIDGGGPSPMMTPLAMSTTWEEDSTRVGPLTKTSIWTEPVDAAWNVSRYRPVNSSATVSYAAARSAASTAVMIEPLEVSDDRASWALSEVCRATARTSAFASAAAAIAWSRLAVLTVSAPSERTTKTCLASASVNCSAAVTTAS